MLIQIGDRILNTALIASVEIDRAESCEAETSSPPYVEVSFGHEDDGFGFKGDEAEWLWGVLSRQCEHRWKGPVMAMEIIP